MPHEKSRQVLDHIAASATDEQKQALVRWADSLLTIQESNKPLAKKVADSISATADFSTLKPILTFIGKELTPRELSALSDALLSIYGSNLSGLANQAATPLRLALGKSA